MKSFPLESINLEAAQNKQFELVACISKIFTGSEFLQMGDVGVVLNQNQPTYTKKVEQVLALFFHQEDAVLVRGSGTAAIREGLLSMIGCNTKLLVHDAPIYETTKVTLENANINTVKVNYNDQNAVKEALKDETLDGILVQYSRQKLDDAYDVVELLDSMKANSNLPILCDDNYVVMKVDQIGVEAQADLSAFSMFKLLGPAGIGCVVGKHTYIEKIRKSHYSGGSQVQGYEAMDALRSLVYAPVSLAIQAQVVDEVVNILRNETNETIEDVFVANAQSKVIIVKFKYPIAQQVLKEAEKLGAIPYPVGAESRFEVIPLFYRVSKTFGDSMQDARDYYIRINPYRSGSKQVLQILKEAIARVM